VLNGIDYKSFTTNDAGCQVVGSKACIFNLQGMHHLQAFEHKRFTASLENAARE
jgi:hypothetical protein